MATNRTSNPGPDPTTCNTPSDATHNDGPVQAPNQVCDWPKGHDDGDVHYDGRTGFFTKQS